MAEFQWEVTLPDGKVILESEQKFDLAWEKPGAVKLFVLKEIGGDSKHSINLETGEFNINGNKDIPEEGIPGDFALKFFRRNIVEMSSNGLIQSHIRVPYLGYIKDGKERLVRIKDGY
jgi:hypothetical protein